MGHGEQGAGKGRVLMPLIGCLAAATLASACGGGQADAGVVARVRGAPITKAQVDHWMSVVAAGASTGPRQPKFQTPKPPRYQACIAYLAKYPSFGAGVEPLKSFSQGSLKAKCEFEYEKEKLKALYVLIAYDWVTGEAAELGAKLAPGALSGTLDAFAHQSFPNGEGLSGYLASMRQTKADITMEIKQELLVSAVQRKLEAQPRVRELTQQQRQLVLTKFGQEYRRKWTQRTDCQAGYVVPICKQYKKPKTPPRLVPNEVPLTNLAAQ
jgi:hypothetical protein